MSRLMLAALISVPVMTSRPLHSQSAGEQEKARTVQYWLDVAAEMAERQSITSLADPGDKFTLQPRAVFRHTQSVRGGDDIGAVYVWTTNSGRPAAIGVFFSWSQDRHRWVMQEFHSLHDEPIRKEMSGFKTWTCKVPGLNWMTTQDLPQPADDLRRLKLQARQFPRKLRVQTKKSDDQGYQLRSVPKPFYEYSDVDAGILHGAVFGFCQGTDTELLLVLEARQSESGKSWRYALASFTDYGIAAELPDGTIWNAPDGEINEDGKPHFWSFLEKRPKPDFEK